MTKIFLTGATGYVGGQVLYELNQIGQYSISALVRKEEDGKTISAKYPNVKIIIGDLDDSDIIRDATSEADIVLHLAHNKHMKSVSTIAETLSSRSSSKPAYYIQISGASVLAAGELASKSFVPGSPSDLVFDDYKGAAQIRNLIRAHSSRAVDNYILDLAEKFPSVKTALVFPPVIYGQGQGPVNQRSIQVPTIAKVTLERGNAVQIGKAQNRWSNVHVKDLGRLISHLVREAAQCQARDEVWSEQGLYLTGVGETTFSSISQKILKAAKEQSLIDHSAVVEELYGEDASKVIPYGPIMYGTNARGQGKRAESLLGWKPQEESLEAEIPKTVAKEAGKA